METPFYGFCPVCGHHGQSRERRPDGNDKCVRGHTYPSLDAVTDLQEAQAIQNRHNAKGSVEVTAELREKQVKAWQVARDLPDIDWLKKAITAGSVGVDTEIVDTKQQVLCIDVWTPFGKVVAGLGDWAVLTISGQVVAMSNKDFHETFQVIR